jgi:hypothetical protein
MAPSFKKERPRIAACLRGGGEDQWPDLSRFWPSRERSPVTVNPSLCLRNLSSEVSLLPRQARFVPSLVLVAMVQQGMAIDPPPVR